MMGTIVCYDDVGCLGRWHLIVINRLEMKQLSAEINTPLDKLALLGYSALWLEAGLITSAFLDRQIETFNDGLDDHSEHYRYAAFLQWMDSKEYFTQDDISAFTVLIQEDGDSSMAESVAFRLLNHPHLTDEQFERLSSFIAEYADGSRSEKILRAVLLRRLQKRSTVSPEEFAECLQKGDGAVHSYLLDAFSQNNPEFLYQLAEKGANKKVRNMAGARYRALSRSLKK